MVARTLQLKPVSLLLNMLCAFVLAFLVLPTLIVIPMSFSDSTFLEFPPRVWSFRWYHAFFDSQEWRRAAGVSLRAAFLTALIATPLGTAAACGLYRAGMRLKCVLMIIILAPMIVPVILVGIGLFVFFAYLGLNSTLTGLVLAHVALALPFVVLTMLAGLSNHDPSQMQAAQSLGAGRLRAFIGVVVPLLRGSVLASFLFSFITSLDEVVVAMFVSGGDNATLTRRMFNSLRDSIDPTVAAISTCLILLSLLLMGIVHWLNRRRALARG
jgi:putative spermidine/putrescine transport system permease protein